MIVHITQTYSDSWRWRWRWRKAEERAWLDERWVWWISEAGKNRKVKTTQGMKRSVREVEACQEAHDQETWWSVRAHLTDCCSLKRQNKEPKAAVPLTSVSIHPVVKRITQSPCERWLVSHQSCFLSWPHEGNTQLEFSGVCEGWAESSFWSDLQN